MKFTVKGIGEITLTQKDFIADGGEGDVYGVHRTAYKIYKDPAKMLPVAKIQELSVLTHPNIIRPQQILLDKKNRPVGYSMRLVDGLPLCQLFTKAFCQRNNIDNDQKLKLVKELRDLVEFTHKQGIVIVDLNELNYLVSSKFNELYAIDVNSYQTPSFPATVIMDTVRDRHCKNQFGPNTDWFSWGVVTFQMLIGIHPYKGSHPSTQNISRDEWMNYRMEKNISVFHKDATIPKICQPFDVVPPALLSWYKAVFENGQRIAPPVDFTSAGPIVITVKKVTGSNLFNIMELANFPSDILSVFAYQGNRVVVTDHMVHLNGRQYSLPSNDVKLTFTPKMSRPVAVYLESDFVRVFDVLNQTQLAFHSNASAIMQCDDRIYVQNGTNVLELMFFEQGSGVNVLSKVVGHVLDLPGATKAFEGVIFQNLLGRRHAALFPAPGVCYQIGIAELDKHKIIDAKFQNNVLVVIGVDHDGKYHRFVFRFSSDYQKYDVRKVENIVYTGLNFTVNDAGICTLINEEEKMEAFSNKKDAGTVKVLDDPAVESDMRLYHDGTKIMFARGHSLYSIGMKP